MVDDIRDKIVPTNDYVFKKLFGEEKDKIILISFLNALFKEYDFLPYIKDVSIKNSETTKDYDPEKLSRLDIKAKVDNETYIDIEMQNRNYFDLIERGIYYCSKILSEETVKGRNYKYPKVVSIWIINDDLDTDHPHFKRKNPIEVDQHFTIPGVIDKDYVRTSDKVTIIYIYLKKYRDGLYHEEIENWIKFINNYEKYNVYDSGIDEAEKKLSKLKYDKETLTVMRSIDEKEMDNEAIKYTLQQRGLKEGLEKGLKEGLKKGLDKGLKEGLKKGLDKGLKEGLKEGLKKGEKNKSIEIAKNMLKLNIDINTISKSTGLSIEEINLLLK